MSRVKKRVLVKWFSLVAIALMAIVLLMLSWLYTTESGLQWLAARITQFQPPGLSIGKVSGSLNTRVKLTELNWQAPDTQVHATGLEVDCQWLLLIDGLVSCKKLALSSVALSSFSDKASNSQGDTWPELATVKLPISIKVKQTSIARISYKQISLNDTAEQKISGLSITRLALAGSKASVGALNFTLQEHSFSASGYVDMRKQWQHQLEIKALGAKFAGKVNSKGSISELSQLSLALQVPNQLTMTTDWFYKNGLFLKHGTLIAEKQPIEISNQEIIVEQAKAKFALNWPKLSATLQTQVTWQTLENIQLDVKTELSNILDWQSSSAISLQVSTAFEEQQVMASLQSMLALAAEDTVSTAKQSWPMLANVDMTIEQGVLTLNSSDIKFGELTASLQSEFNINNPMAADVLLAGELDGGQLVLKNVLELNNIKANWQIKKQQSKWLIASQGQVDKLALTNFDGENIHWAVDFSERWQGDLKADAVNINDVDIELLSLKVTGLPQTHQAAFSATVANNTKVNLTFDGQLLTEQKKSLALSDDLTQALWVVNSLKFNALNQGQTLSLAAEQLQLSTDKQSLVNLCLNGSGKLCVNARHHLNQWHGDLSFEQWSISPVFEQFRAWQAIRPAQYPQTVAGKVTGKLQLSGKDKQLEKLTGNISIPSLQWLSSDGQVSVQDFAINSEQQQNALAITTQWQEVITNLYQPEWPAKITMPDGELLVSIAPDFKVDFALQQADINIAILDENNKADAEIFKPLLTVGLVKLEGEWLQDKLKTDLKILLPAEDEITAQFSSEWPIADAARISGRLALNIKQFDWLKQWQKRIDKIELSLVQNFTIAGTWQKPLFAGEGALDINHLVIEDYGLDIRSSKIKLSSQQDTIVVLGELQNPQGALTIAGDAKLSAPMTGNLTIAGQQVTLVNNSENKLIVSPKLTANYQNKHLKVDGHLVVDQADIKIAALPKPAISVSEDQVILDEKDTSVKDSPIDYNISLSLSAGNNVQISGFGLSSEIEGILSSSLISGQPLTLNGRLDLKNGKFEAYKQVLTIEQGQLLFLGTPGNPSIQFRAVRIVDDIKVGIIADGTIQKPRLTLFSAPAMADENILALLITGRNIESLSKQEGNALTSAAISLGVESANKLVQKIGEKLGLKDIAFTSKDGSNGSSTRVDIAAKINDRLNVGYGTNIDSDNSIQAGFIIEYKLSPSISFEATSGEEISANINYKKQYSPIKDKKKPKDKE
tara:strand:- start:9781 stop:13485 length:3705 start_codon:yes stop_codon:yes gene_type:complete